MIAFLFFILTAIGTGFSQDVTLKVKEFFSRNGYVVEVLEDGRVITDLGRGKVFPGERFEVVREGKELTHPVTGQVIGKVEERIGTLTVEEVEETYSIGAFEGKEVKKGDRVRLVRGKVCLSGSDELLFRLSAVIEDLKKDSQNCNYMVREMEGGIGIEFGSKAVAFFELSKRPPSAVAEEGIKRISLKSELIMSLKSLPLSADLCRLTSSDKRFLAVLTESRLEIYELMNGEPVKYYETRLPDGDPVYIQCAEIGGYQKDLIILNMFTGDTPEAYIFKLVGENLEPVVKRYKKFIAVLDKNNPEETLVSQEFDSRDLWGTVRKLKLSGDLLFEKEELKVPSDFRIDSAIQVGDLLVFVDSRGYLRVFRGDNQLLSRRGFGGSYITAEIPGTVEDEDSYIFNPRPFLITVGERSFAGVIKNETSAVYKFLNVAKYQEGELYALIPQDDEVALKRVKSRKFEEAVQAVLTDEEKVYIVTGKKGTLSIQNTGEVYEGTFVVR